MREPVPSKLPYSLADATQFGCCLSVHGGWIACNADPLPTPMSNSKHSAITRANKILRFAYATTVSSTGALLWQEKGALSFRDRFTQAFEDGEHVFPQVSFFGEGGIVQQIIRVQRRHERDARKLAPRAA